MARDLLEAAFRASVEGGALLLLLWLLTRAWPRVPAGARCVLWWLACLRMLLGLAPIPRFAFPWRPDALPLPAPVQTGAAAWNGLVAVPGGGPAPAGSIEGLAVAALATLWIGGAALSLLVMVRRMLALGSAWRGARPSEDPRVRAWGTEWSVALGSVPEVRVSAAIAAPVSIGIGRPRVLLPGDAARLSDEALRLVLAHELAHARRRDPLLAWVPALAQVVFWFHPLVRLAAREYLAAREETCDAGALRATGASPHTYGSLLLAYGTGSPSSLPGAASCGSPDHRLLRRRLHMLSRPSPIGFAGRAAAALLTIVFCALAFAPVRFVQAHEPTPGERFLAANERVPIAYLIKARGMKGTRGSGNTEDLASAHRLERLDADAVYFRLGERRWIATDPRTLAEVHEAVEPERRFEERQLVVSGRRDGLEAERLKLERRHEDLVAGKDRLEQIRRALQERIDAARETDGSARGLAAERDAIEEARIELWAAEQELHKARSMLARRMKSLHEEDRLDHAERERVHRRILERVAEICRAAVADGRAGEFVP